MGGGEEVRGRGAERPRRRRLEERGGQVSRQSICEGMISPLSSFLPQPPAHLMAPPSPSLFPSSPSAPRGRVAATASLATCLPLRTYSRSGVLARKDGDPTLTLPRKS